MVNQIWYLVEEHLFGPLYNIARGKYIIDIYFIFRKIFFVMYSCLIGRVLDENYE